MTARWSLLLVLAAGLAGCGTGRPGEEATAPQEIVVFAASSLTDAFTELAEAFEVEHPAARILLHFAGSSQLAAQLAEGVPADVFASANPEQMQAAISAGRIDPGAGAIFVSNRLTIIVPTGNPAGVASLEDLARPGILLILAVEGVPVRAYTDEIAAGLGTGFQEGFYGNLVSEEENVRQVVAKVALGEADAGIVYTSDVSPDIAGQVAQIAIPEVRNVVALYPIAPLADSPHPEWAQAFVDFVLSPAGREILARRGFGPPPSR